MKVLILDIAGEQLYSFPYDSDNGELRVGDIINKYRLTKFIKLELHYIVFQGEQI